jgi:hypothetical protein
MKSPDPQFLSLEEAAPLEPASARRQAFTWGTALVVTVGGLATALVLGTIGYDVRRSSMHEARLKGILIQTPTVYQVTEGLKEKAPLAAIVDSDETLRSAVERWGGAEVASITEKAVRWPQLRVYSAGDMMYFIFFDAEDIMRDYVYVSSSGRD